MTAHLTYELLPVSLLSRLYLRRILPHSAPLLTPPPSLHARSGDVTFCPGGCAQNTARIYRWIVADRSTVTFVGAVGADKFGRRLEKLVRADGVDTRYWGRSAGVAAQSVLATEVVVWSD